MTRARWLVAGGWWLVAPGGTGTVPGGVLSAMTDSKGKPMTIANEFTPATEAQP